MRAIRIFAIAVSSVAAVLAQNNCGPEAEVLFQSNAFTSDSMAFDSYQGVSVIQDQGDWDEFLLSFEPINFEESMTRTSIAFTYEKVVVGTYFVISTCYVELSYAQLECTASDVQTSSVQMQIIMDVLDASIGCDLKCAALGQVVFAVAVPLAWEVDEDEGLQMHVDGPCISPLATASAFPTYAFTPFPTPSPAEFSVLTSTKATAIQSSDELDTSSTTDATVTSFSSLGTSTSHTTTTSFASEMATLSTTSVALATTTTVLNSNSDIVSSTTLPETSPLPKITTTQLTWVETDHTHGPVSTTPSTNVGVVEDPIKSLTTTVATVSATSVAPDNGNQLDDAASLPAEIKVNETEGASSSRRQHSTSYVLFAVLLFFIHK